LRYSVLIDNLQNLTNSKVDISEIAKVIGKPARTLYTRGQRDTEFKQSEINQIEEFYKVNLSKSDTSNNNSVILDYYPDIFGSCGTGYFVSSEQKEQIQVPVNALFKSLSKGKKYSVINAKGNSMSPYIHSGDKLIVEHLDNQPIIDNHVYIFCYDNDLYVKRLYKNIDEIIAKSDNPDPIFKVKSIPKEEWNNLQLIGEIVGLMRELK
jgi:phage repressor protein C with HTH and peptisase S24 domain